VPDLQRKRRRLDLSQLSIENSISIEPTTRSTVGTNYQIGTVLSLSSPSELSTGTIPNQRGMAGETSLEDASLGVRQAVSDN
jgi:hypothetical protein